MESTPNLKKLSVTATETNNSSSTTQQQRTPSPSSTDASTAVKLQPSANMKHSTATVLTEAQLQAKRERREAKLKKRLEKEKQKQIPTFTSPPPPLPKRKKLKMPKISFPINEECTSLKLAPSGRHIIAAFTDGTLRLFDTTGRLWSPSPSNEIQSEMNHLFDSDSDDDFKGKAKQRMVASKSFQNYGAVACQIHARGVITSLLMDVDICQDGKFAFGGVLRGSTELVAVDLSLVEQYHDGYLDQEGNEQGQKMDILDLIRVYRHGDAKLKGFGACVRLKGSVPEYRLFTGKGIKNMHIWSFIPPHGDKKEPTWQCLYDTPTNGNTITYLQFRRDSNGLLQGISKSDDQKLRIWDLSYEEEEKDSSQKSVIKQLAQKAEKEACHDRPKRPPYIDVISTENALSVCGSYVFSGGDSMYNKLGVMYLDVENIQCPFNHTELALPNANGQVEAAAAGRRSARSGRQQRGDLKSVVKVAGMNRDAHDVLLELSDQSLMHYSQTGSQPTLNPLAFTCAEQSERKICITRLQSKKSVIALAIYEENKNRGTITMKYLSEKNEGSSIGPSVRTGYTEPISKQQMVQLEKMRSLKLEQQQRMADEILRVKKAEKKMKKKMGQLSPGAMSNSTSPSASVVSMRSIGSAERHKSKKEDFVSPDLKRKSIEEGSHKSKYAKISPVGGANMSPEIITKSSHSSLIPEETPVKRSKSKSPSPAPVVKSPIKNSTSQKSKAGSRAKKSISPVSSTKPSYTTSPQSNNTSLESSTVGVAVSPEMSKTIESTSATPEVVETSKPITKFFDQKKEGKSSFGNQSQTKKKISRKVKFIHQSPLKVSSPQTKTEKETSTSRPLNEGDIATALKELKKIASDPTLTSNDDYPSISKGVNVEMLDYISTCHVRKRPKLTQKSSLPIYKKSNTIFKVDSAPIDLDRQHFEARRLLALNHRSEHERLRNAVVQSGERIMNALNCEDSKCTTKSHWIEYVNKSLTEALVSHQNALADMLQRQQMESKSLANSQMLEKGSYVPQMAVSFPFPDVFQQVETSTKSFLSC